MPEGVPIQRARNGAELIARAREERDYAGISKYKGHELKLGPEDDLVRAALCYLTPPEDRQPSGTQIGTGDGYIEIPQGWPWSAREWYPQPDDRAVELIEVGLLIAQEIERLAVIREQRTVEGWFLRHPGEPMSTTRGLVTSLAEYEALPVWGSS